VLHNASDSESVQSNSANNCFGRISLFVKTFSSCATSRNQNDFHHARHNLEMISAEVKLDKRNRTLERK